MKIPLLLLGFLVSVSAIAQAGPARGGVHSGFAGRGPVAVHGGTFNRGGFQSRFIAPRNGAGIRTGNGFHRDFANRRFRNRGVVFQQYGWPLYWYPWYPYDDLNYSDLEPDSQPDYQYWDNSSAYVQPQSTNQAVPQNPLVVVVNAGNSRPTGFNAPINPGGNSGYYNGYGYNAGLAQQRMVVQGPYERTANGSITPGDPIVQQATPDPPQNTQTAVQTGTGPFSKFVIVSWLNDRGKEVLAIKNTQTNNVQRITSEPNIDHFRIVEIHPNPDLRQFEAIISNGSDQGPVRFQF